MDRNSICPKYYYLLGNEYERTAEWEKAAQAYRDAVLRKEEYEPQWFYRLGYVLTKAGCYQDACRAFLETQILKKPYGVSRNLYNKSEAFKRVVDYTEYFEELEIQDKTVLYESYHGVSMSCNPYAIFLHMLDRPEFSEWTHIWVINDKSKIPQKFRTIHNIIFVARDSYLYLKYLSSVKYLINNSTFPAYFIRKREQIYLNTWHGTPLKTLGKDIKTTFMEHSNTAKNFLHTTHLLSPNPHTTNILVNRYDIAGSYRGIVAETGYPRIDLTLNISEQEKTELKGRMGIALSEKVVLYAPTWRGVLGSAQQYDTDQLIKDLKAIEQLGCHVLFRGHYFVENALFDSSIKSCVVPEDIDTNTLLAIVDVLITDYSSIAFDFLPTAKPIIYYVYDLDEYQLDRGLYFSMEEMPGRKCQTSEDLQNAIHEAINNQVDDTLYNKVAQDRFCPYEDGTVTRRVVELVFFGKRDNVIIKENDSRKSLLIYGGIFQPNGILTSYLNLLNRIDKSNYTTTIAIDPAQVNSLSERIEQFNRLPEDVQVIGRSGRLDMTLEEKFVVDTFNEQNSLYSDEMRDLYKQVFRREYIRMFGYAHFDSVIQFEGYSRFWISVFAFLAENSKTRKVVYLHNDMLAEWKVRFPYLEAIFKLYPLFNSLISVSKQTCKYNCKNLSARFNINKSRFDYCDNIQNPEQIFSLAKEPLTTESLSLFEGRGAIFITVGRLSPEKDQAKLINAFALLVEKYPESRLIILGEGPLRQSLLYLTVSLGLNKHVFLLGYISNPFPFLQEADCFILSSNHEGQPMVLFEAMILGKPIIATDIVGSRSVLEDGYGLLVENSERGLFQGMCQFEEGKLKLKNFDYQKYQERAINMFYEKVIE